MNISEMLAKSCSRGLAEETQIEERPELGLGVFESNREELVLRRGDLEGWLLLGVEVNRAGGPVIVPVVFRVETPLELLLLQPGLDPVHDRPYTDERADLGDVLVDRIVVDVELVYDGEHTNKNVFCVWDGSRRFVEVLLTKLEIIAKLLAVSKSLVVLADIHAV
ncbi:uncharacterized protein FPRO_16110 [Fusarium proliferatum ET1]|uniref:Uncharacterized protein n=1 Tax=Fusarium proliferatum (strain ET1) TaxID=1227346 RepID=A0A1L7WBB0_FUSPR|nr:uncharacterized protein FPRO_16110 [Fusarium proliferatum ET1]CZR49905.1 uncharacterized protein FPRO_16110 [Fusarium proliferatum ET1]